MAQKSIDQLLSIKLNYYFVPPHLYYSYVQFLSDQPPTPTMNDIHHTIAQTCCGARLCSLIRPAVASVAGHGLGEIGVDFSLLSPAMAHTASVITAHVLMPLIHFGWFAFLLVRCCARESGRKLVCSILVFLCLVRGCYLSLLST